MKKNKGEVRIRRKLRGKKNKGGKPVTKKINAARRRVKGYKNPGKYQVNETGIIKRVK